MPGIRRHAAKVRHTLGENVEGGFLWALRNVCDTLLTFVEAIDPVSEMTLEGLRNKIDVQLTPSDKPEN